jgi:hypothetical protein
MHSIIRPTVKRIEKGEDFAKTVKSQPILSLRLHWKFHCSQFVLEVARCSHEEEDLCKKIFFKKRHVKKPTEVAGKLPQRHFNPRIKKSSFAYGLLSSRSERRK